MVITLGHILLEESMETKWLVPSYVSNNIVCHCHYHDNGSMVSKIQINKQERNKKKILRIIFNQYLEKPSNSGLEI